YSSSSDQEALWRAGNICVAVPIPSGAIELLAGIGKRSRSKRGSPAMESLHSLSTVIIGGQN
ncbi:MAG TPA: hypothetical protein VGS41_02950, partial [Chthonomonadales bacterium]|nr:hypothetical protein [Chthonomonadales bacterium]